MNKQPVKAKVAKTKKQLQIKNLFLSASLGGISLFHWSSFLIPFYASLIDFTLGSITIL